MNWTGPKTEPCGTLQLTLINCMLICLSVVLLVAIRNDVLVDPTLVGSIQFGGTRKHHQWNSGGMPYDVVMVVKRCNGPRRLREYDDDLPVKKLTLIHDSRSLTCSFKPSSGKASCTIYSLLCGHVAVNVIRTTLCHWLTLLNIIQHFMTQAMMTIHQAHRRLELWKTVHTLLSLIVKNA